MEFNSRSHPVPSPAEDLSLLHLQAGLRCLDLRIQQEVLRWKRAGQDPCDHYRGLYISDGTAQALLQRSFATSWGAGVTLEPGEEQGFAEELAKAQREAEALAVEARRRGHPARLERLAETFQLDRFELGVFVLCLAPALDIRYERLYGYLQDDVTRRRPSLDLALNLLSEPGQARLERLRDFGPGSPLFEGHLLVWASEGGTVRLNRSLVVDETVVDWLLGAARLHPALGPVAELQSTTPGPTDELLAGEAWAQIQALLSRFEAPNPPPLLSLYGDDNDAQEACARLLAADLGRPLLTLDLAATVNLPEPDLKLTLNLAQRDARLHGALLCIRGWDGGQVDAETQHRLLSRPAGQAIPVIFSGQAAWLPHNLPPGTRLVWIEVGAPPYERRRSLWEHYLGETGRLLDLVTLSGQFTLKGGQIRDAAAAARNSAAQSGLPLQSEHLFAAARQYSSARLSGLARKVRPRYGWDDIILPEDQLALLKEIPATVRARPVVLGEWGLARKLVPSQGVTVMFSGPPGTGKTMAAEVIAGELGLDLYKIDLSGVVSKYIGETEKNLERIFSEAASSNAILFFDEADALFGKRSEVRDAHDRYANIEISYLLQRMESYDGITILATNLRANLDEAFIRRLQFAVDFPFPSEGDRLRIWKTLLPEGVPHSPALDLERMARQFKLAGGNIRNILVSATYLAAADGGVVTMSHLLHGARRELQKMGRLVNELDLVAGSDFPQP